MKKQVLFVVDSLNCGGAEKSLVSLLPLLDYGKMDIDLLIVHRGGLFERYLPPSAHLVSLPRTVWHTLVQKGCQLCFSTLLKSFRFRKPRHIAELHWQTMHAGLAPMKHRYDTAVAWHQGFPTYYVATRVKAAKKYAWVNTDLHKAGYRELFNRPFYDCFDNIVAVSESLHKILTNTNYADKTKICTIYDILNPEWIQNMAQEKKGRNILDKNGLRLVTVGRMTWPKNFSLAVETANILKNKNLAFHWYFVGDGPERESIEQLVEEYGLQQHITLLGTQPNPYPYMAGCDLYVQTSRFEGFCLTLREARLLHKPVVSTNFPVVHDQIQDGINGLIAEMTAESLAEKIRRLADDPDLREKLSAATRHEENRTAETEAAKVNQMLLAE